MDDQYENDWFLDISDQVEEWKLNNESDIYETPAKALKPHSPRIYGSEFDLPDNYDGLLLDD
jgi:hypothetical protein